MGGMGVQQLGESFRSAEKGATSTKRLKTTTYVPSFDVTGYNMNTIQNAIASRTGGSKAKYKDLLSTPKPNTNKQYIEIYTATMNQMLPAFKAAEAKGISYMESVKMVPCSELQGSLKQLSTGQNRQATACCTGSLQNTAEGGCGATLSQATQFRKKNANGNNDGGHYSGREFLLNRYMTLYGCPRACMYPITVAENGNVADPVVKSSQGTCINYLSGQGCTATKNSAFTDCRACAGIFNNVAPQSFTSNFQIGKPNTEGSLTRMISRLNSAPKGEPIANVLNVGGQALGEDNTAVCHTPISFSCPGNDKDFEKNVDAGKCKEVQSAKVDNMCDDGPCDNDENSNACLLAKDHLPFRTYDSATIAAYPYKGPKNGGDDDSLQVNNVNVATVLKALPGEPKLTPLRWNNPHASEVEVNLWIMCSDPPTIVPVKKPACSGEGNQNNIIQWAIPSDFNNVNWGACQSTKCFTGCNTAGDCVLQTYAHSVETRQYSNAVPIIIPKQTFNGQKLAYNSVPKDAPESKSFAWPANFDLSSMVKGAKAQAPPRNNLPAASLDNVQICASSEREGVSTNGDQAAFVKLNDVGQTAQQLNSGTVNLYLCKTNDAETAAEQLVDKVVFTITNNGDGSAAGSKTESYTPFEFSSTNQFGGAGVKKVTAVITPYNGNPKTIAKLIDLRGNGKRWRFRRHLQAVCANGLPKAVPDPWMDLSKLKRETCLSAQDPNSNYDKTQVQIAVLHS